MSEPSDNNNNSSRETTPKSRLRTPESSTSPSALGQVAGDEYMPEVVKLSKSKGANALDKYFSEDADGLFFRNSKAALDAMDYAQWHPPVNDATVPWNEEQDRSIVRRLVDAFLDTDGAMDTEGNAYRKRLTPGTNVFYDPWTIERCAWEVLHMVKDMHTNGFKAPILDVDILKAIGQTELWTFEDRIVMICRVLKASKSVAVSLMKHEKVWTTIGAPHKLYSSTLVNTQSNAFRNKWVKAGRAAEKGQKKAPDDSSADLPTQKRQRRNTTTPNRGAITFAPSPLASTVPFTTTTTTTFINTTPNRIHPARSTSSTFPQRSADTDVEMADSPEEKVRDTIEVQGEPNDKTPVSIKTEKFGFSSMNLAALNKEISGDVSIVDAHTSRPASAARAAADVDAAEMLLGLRAA